MKKSKKEITAMLKIILEYKDTYSTEIFKEEDKGYYSSLDTEKWPYSLGYIIREYTNYIDKTEPNSLDIFSENKHLHITYRGHNLSILQCLPKEDSFINYLTTTKFIPKRKLHGVVEQFMQFVDKEEKLKYIDKNINANLILGKTLPTKIMKIICIYKQQVLPIWKDKDKYYCVFIKEDIHHSQHPVSNSSLDKILELYKDHIDTSKYITSEDYNLELEVNYKDEVRNYNNLPSADDTITKFINQVDNENMKTLTTKDMKISFTFGNTVTINITQDKEGFYNYTPKNNITSLIQFFSIKDAILFFSEFLPVKVYDKDEDSLTFVVNIEYKNVGIAFYMLDEDRTKSGWINYNAENKGLNKALKINQKVDDSIDNTIKHFINFVDKEEEDNELNINGKTYLIKYEEENKGDYVMFTPFLRITGKSIEEVKEKIKEIYWAFGVDN